MRPQDRLRQAAHGGKKKIEDEELIYTGDEAGSVSEMTHTHTCLCAVAGV